MEGRFHGPKVHTSWQYTLYNSGIKPQMLQTSGLLVFKQIAGSYYFFVYLRQHDSGNWLIFLRRHPLKTVPASLCSIFLIADSFRTNNLL